MAYRSGFPLGPGGAPGMFTLRREIDRRIVRPVRARKPSVPTPLRPERVARIAPATL